MELKKGMYVRTEKGKISKIKWITAQKWEGLENTVEASFMLENNESFEYPRDNFKASNYIIDLIEVGDLIETPKGIFQVGYIENNVIYTGNSKVIACLREDEHLCFENTTITSIVTKEQFEIQKYYVESE